MSQSHTTLQTLEVRQELDEHALALSFALETDQHIFLTGKAGSGKTTLLKQVAEKTLKNFVIAAPTGVAAINAGGVTIHSLFHLPTISLIPSNDFVNANVAANRNFLVSHLRFNREKKRVLEELELLIIDEVSMVRADILDGVDFALQFIRKNNKPFGGVQVLLIGDMHHLPPVVKEQEWQLLKNYYESPYFFDSLVWKKLDAVQVELKKIYRQQDERFLSILNNIRDKELNEDDFLQLEKRYKPGSRPEKEGTIILTTHNWKSDNVNESELKKLPGTMHSFEAEVEGEFPENMYPCDANLILKEEAQVMFIKNDVEQGKYFNGKLARIKSISGGNITVTFNDTGENFVLKKETWENIRYTVDKNTGKVEKDELGSFSQYPLRLAWAITIHKSQGLTFDNVIIDAGQSFAAGQVYVALSRCRTLEGITLHSRITPSALYTDEKINSFSRTHHSTTSLKDVLESARTRYAHELLRRLFAFEKFRNRMAEWKEIISEREIDGKEKIMSLAVELGKSTEEIIATAGKFRHQLESLLQNISADGNQIDELKERCSKAIEYFTELIYHKLASPLHDHIKTYSIKHGFKRYLDHVRESEDLCWLKINSLYNAVFLDKKLYDAEPKFTRTTKDQKSKRGNKKDSTFEITLALYKEGKSIDEIATARSLKPSTIKTHFTRWILTGDIDISKVFSENQLDRLTIFLSKTNGGYQAFQSAFGSEFDYNDLRMVINYQLTKKNNSKSESNK
jgi:ATP-dependent DNA helicase PIF1